MDIHKCILIRKQHRQKRLDRAAKFGIIILAAQRSRQKYAGVAHLAERHLAKVEVASSNLVARSKKRDIDKVDVSFFARPLSLAHPKGFGAMQEIGYAEIRAGHLASRGNTHGIYFIKTPESKGLQKQPFNFGFAIICGFTLLQNQEVGKRNFLKIIRGLSQIFS